MCKGIQLYHRFIVRKKNKILKIAVNTRLLLKDKLEGIGWFTYETLKRITQKHKEHEFFFIFDRKFDNSFIFSDNITPLKIPPPARHPVLFYLWFEHTLPAQLKKIKPDLFFSPDGYLSLKTDIPSINVIHDLNFEHFPKDIPWFSRKHYQYYFPRYANKAARIASVSEYSRQDIVKLFNIETEKIDVVYNGANESFMPLNPVEKKNTRSKYTNGHPYFVFVGALNPRKNLVNLLKAFDIYKKMSASANKLLVVGEKMFKTSEIENTYNQMKFNNDVIFTGRLQSDQLHKVLASALALTYVSYFEGFGIPIVEAFKCNTPVITSNVTSMPEVAGNAAILVDPFNPEEIAVAMKRTEDDSELVQKLIAEGNKRAKIFTWQKSAERLWETIEKVIYNKN